MRAAPAGAVGSGSGRKAEVMAPVMAAPAARGKPIFGREKMAWLPAGAGVRFAA